MGDTSSSNLITRYVHESMNNDILTEPKVYFPAKTDTLRLPIPSQQVFGDMENDGNTPKDHDIRFVAHGKVASFRGMRSSSCQDQPRLAALPPSHGKETIKGPFVMFTPKDA